jgi:hypothetical protein
MFKSTQITKKYWEYLGTTIPQAKPGLVIVVLSLALLADVLEQLIVFRALLCIILLRFLLRLGIVLDFDPLYLPVWD